MSFFCIKDAVFIEMSIENEELPKSPNVFSDISIHEHVMQAVPTLECILNDATSATVQKFHLTDGTLISVNIAKSEETKQLRSNFRVFSSDTARVNSEGNFNHITCMLDTPKYLGKSISCAVKGNSNAAMEKICGDCNLTLEADSTEDMQVWMGAGITYSRWAKQIAEAGYISPNSCMLVAVTDKQKLLYKDAIKIINSKPKYKFIDSLSIDPEPNTFIIYSHLNHSSSGVLNHWCNYGYSLYTESFSEQKLIKEVEVVKPLPYLAMSAKMKEEIEVSRLDIAPFNCGNVHKNYMQALYQNFRFKMTFSESMSVIIMDVSDIQLLDVVEVLIGTTVFDPTHTVKSGSYLVVAKTKIIRNGSNYGERFELLRNSMDNSGIHALIQ